MPKLKTLIVVLSVSVQCWGHEPPQLKDISNFSSPGVYTGRYIDHQNCRTQEGNHFCLEVDFELENHSLRRFAVLFPVVKDASGKTLFSFDIANSDHQGFATTRAKARKMLAIIFDTRDIVSVKLVNHSFTDIPYFLPKRSLFLIFLNT